MAASLATGRDDAAQRNQRNRAELAAVLGSDSFKRSPKLSRLLVYLCEKYFQGLAGDITEYAIGIDVLGRDSGFDPQQDALVRVDTHHLRKRLKEYYATAGLDHEVQIVLPNGRYAPEFVLQQAAAPTVKEPGTAAAQPFPQAESASPAVQLWRRTQAWRTEAKLAWAGGLAVLVVAAGCWYLAAGARKAVPSPSAAIPAGVIAGQADAIRIAAGSASADYVDHVGRVWMSDRFFAGGTPFHRGPAQI